WIVVVVRVHADPPRRLDLGVRDPVGPEDAVRAARDLRWEARVLPLELRKLRVVTGGELRLRRRARRAGSEHRMEPDLETVGQVTGGLRVRENARRKHESARPHALPLGDDAARGTELLHPVEVAR